MRRQTGLNVFDEAVARIERLYAEGHELVVTFSGGKDSTVCLNLAKIAARNTGRLPVKAIMRDDEIMPPGTFEYCERVAADPDVELHWIYACQPVINVFNRAQPYWWVFDPDLPPDQWVRQPPPYAYRIPELNISALVTRDRFPTDRMLFNIMGLRVQESPRRLLSVFSAGGAITKANEHNVRNLRPIYDWTHADVWKAIRDQQWDYNEFYNTMLRFRVPIPRMRVAPPTMNPAGVETLSILQRAYPAWFDKVATRCPGVRSAAQYGLRAIQPFHKLGETWRQTFERECVAKAPDWIAERASLVAKKLCARHRRHANEEVPDTEPCYPCSGDFGVGSWKSLARVLYTGDPFCSKIKFGVVKYIEPEFFRPGAGSWGGSPSF